MWTHPRFKNPFYSKKMHDSSLPFRLYGEYANGSETYFEFKSWQQAKKAGWIKAK